MFKALSCVSFYLIWLFVAFLPFVLMLLSDLICIQITSPGGSPIRGKNAVVHLATPRHALPLPSPPLHPVQFVTSPIPILTSPASSSPALAPSTPPATTHIHSQSFPPVDPSIASLDCGAPQLSPALGTASPTAWAFWASPIEGACRLPQ